jgi:hypothetical protein
MSFLLAFLFCSLLFWWGSSSGGSESKGESAQPASQCRVVYRHYFSPTPFVCLFALDWDTRHFVYYTTINVIADRFWQNGENASSDYHARIRTNFDINRWITFIAKKLAVKVYLFNKTAVGDKRRQTIDKWPLETNGDKPETKGDKRRQFRDKRRQFRDKRRQFRDKIDT